MITQMGLNQQTPYSFCMNYISLNFAGVQSTYVQVPVSLVGRCATHGGHWPRCL